MNACFERKFQNSPRRFAKQSKSKYDGSGALLEASGVRAAAPPPSDAAAPEFHQMCTA